MSQLETDQNISILWSNIGNCWSKNKLRDDGESGIFWRYYAVLVNYQVEVEININNWSFDSKYHVKTKKHLMWGWIGNNVVSFNHNWIWNSALIYLSKALKIIENNNL